MYSNAMYSIHNRDASIKLTEMGKWQASETGKLLAQNTKEPFDICFSSPYDRAIHVRILLFYYSIIPFVLYYMIL